MSIFFNGFLIERNEVSQTLSLTLDWALMVCVKSFSTYRSPGWVMKQGKEFKGAVSWNLSKFKLLSENCHQKGVNNTANTKESTDGQTWRL